MRPAVLGAAVLLLAVAWVVARDRLGMQGQGGDYAAPAADDSPLDGALNLVTDALDTITEGYLMPVSLNLADANLQAFQRMIRYAEGTAGANGYRTMFGGRLFDSYADHPRKYWPYANTTTSAAGAYQILERTWDEVKAALGLPDFSPASQDAAAAYLIRRRGALGDVYAGRFAEAVRKCNKEWASLPGSPYGQPTKTLADVQRIYIAAGGNLSEGAVYA